MLNNRLVGYLGLGISSVALLTAVGGFFRVISDPDELVALYEAAHTHSDPSHAVAKVAGAGIAIIGAIIVGTLAAWAGKPARTITGE